MSVVIAIKDKKTGYIHVGCDSQTSRGDMKSTLTGKGCKIWNVKIKSAIIGGTGYMRDIQLVQTCEDIIDELTMWRHEVDFNYMVTKFFTNLYELLKAYNRISKDKEGHLSPTIESRFIVAFDKDAWLVDYDGSIKEIDDYLVIGSGEEVATGVLENNKKLKPEQRIREAIKACADKTLYIDNNVKILCTGDK